MTIIIHTAWHVAANTSQPPLRIQFGVSLVGIEIPLIIDSDEIPENLGSANNYLENEVIKLLLFLCTYTSLSYWFRFFLSYRKVQKVYKE